MTIRLAENQIVVGVIRAEQTSVIVLFRLVLLQHIERPFRHSQFSRFLGLRTLHAKPASGLLQGFGDGEQARIKIEVRPLKCKQFSPATTCGCISAKSG